MGPPAVGVTEVVCLHLVIWYPSWTVSVSVAGQLNHSQIGAEGMKALAKLLVASR